MSNTVISDAAEIIKTLGRADVCLKMGVGNTAMSNVLKDERFPASWYDIMQSLAEEKGLEAIPHHLFNFKKTKSAAP